MTDNGESSPSFRILPLVQPNPDGAEVDVAKIKSFLNVGLSEAPYEDRCLAWLVVLGVFPKNPNDWQKTRWQIMTLYDIYIKEYHVQDWTDKVIEKFTKMDKFELEEKALISLIHKDIVRTGRHICFMPPDENPLEPNEDDKLLPFNKTLRRLERILYVFACSNPNYGYMQGFNELVAPLYYVCKMAKNVFGDDEMEIEAMTFMLLTNLITTTSVQDFYDTKDKSSQLQSLLASYNVIFHRHDEKTAKLFDSIEIDPFLYAYRWFNLLFAQEHDLPNLLIIWDALFAHIDDFSQYILYVGVAHIKTMNHVLSKIEFFEMLETIQKMKQSNALQILKEANKMWNSDEKLRKNVEGGGHKVKQRIK
jgi:hypothetical protein